MHTNIVENSKNLSSECIDQSSSPIAFLYVPLHRFALFSFFSLGFYLIYWSYKQFWIIKINKKEELSPALRSFFIALSSYGLFSRISKNAKLYGYKGINYPGLFAGIFFIQVSFSNILNDINPQNGKLFMLSLIILSTSFLSFLPFQMAINNYYYKNKIAIKKTPIAWYGKILLTCGIIIFSLCLLSILVPIKN